MVYRHVRTLFSIFTGAGARWTTALGVFAFLFGSAAVFSGSSKVCARGSVSTFGTGRSIRRERYASRKGSSQSVRGALQHQSIGQIWDVLGSRLTFAAKASQLTTRGCSSARRVSGGHVSTLTHSRRSFSGRIRLSTIPSQLRESSARPSRVDVRNCYRQCFRLNS